MKSFIIGFILFIGALLQAQSVTVAADKYLHVFKGGGTSIGLFLGHHFSMDDANQDKAVQLMFKDCHMPFLQDYISTSLYPPLDDNYFDKRSSYFKAAKAYNPEVELSLTTNRFPRELVHEEAVGGSLQPVLNYNDSNIYDKVAQFYFDLFLGFKIRGVDIDILNVVNEPDWNKQFYYGHGGDTKKAVALLYAEAVPKFKAMLRDTSINKLRMKIPKIMGVSTIGPQGCIDYIKYFKQNYPKAWEQIDIVSNHQYTNGTNEVALATIKIEANNKPIYQSEMHTNRGDNLGTMPIDSSHRGVLSLAALLGSSLRNGANAWLYFQTNYPNAYTPAGLMYVDWQSKNPTPYQHYYAFQQLTSSQPKNSYLIDRQVLSFGGAEVFVFRKKEQDTVYINIANFLNQSRSVQVDIKGLERNYLIKSYKQFVTDGVLKNDEIGGQNFEDPKEFVSLTLKPFSVNTFKVAIQKQDLTSLNEVPSTFLSVTPNPATNQITITGFDSKYSLKIYDDVGKLVLEKHNLIGSESLNIEELSQGSYILIIDDSTEKKFGKFIKN
jgi:hypothetical protein